MRLPDAWSAKILHILLGILCVLGRARVNSFGCAYLRRRSVNSGSRLRIQLVSAINVASQLRIQFKKGELTSSEQSLVADGFRTHSKEQDAPDYKKERVKWHVLDSQDGVRAILTAEVLWDWIYIDELWVTPELRGQGFGRKLMQLAEDFAGTRGLQGIWLWTQSWQAEDFYRQLGYRQFTRFENFPEGHSRIGFRKTLK